MSELRTFFRHCPACGRRFEIRLVAKEEVDASEHNEERPDVPAVGRPPITTAVRTGGAGPLMVHDSSPVTVDLEEFQYTYRCRHCGHQWSEIHEKTDVEQRPAEYTGD